MTGYKAKSIIVSRGKSDGEYTRMCMVSLFTVTNPHKSGQAPWKIFDFNKIEEVTISGADVRYLLAGNDVLVDNIKAVTVDKKGKKIVVKIRK